jgi:hypothetical protein
MRRRIPFFEKSPYGKIYSLFWGTLSVSKKGFVVWPAWHHGGWQFHLKWPYYRLPNLRWTEYWLVPKRARITKRLLILEWLIFHVWLDLGTIDCQRTPR